MLAVKRILVPLFAAALCLSFFAAGCGDGENRETVFIYITNGYPGSSSLTLYGPNGRLVSGLEFAARTEEPIEVDRNVNSDDFVLVLDGAPTAMQFTKPMFSLYPQETASLIISRRASEGAADATLYRHSRSPDPDCVLTFGNSLSLDNNLMGEELLGYSYQTEWNRDPRPMYMPEYERLASTRCGPTEIPPNYQRPEVHAAIENDPWFFPASGERGGYTMVWAQRELDPRTGEMRSEGISLNGNIIAVPTTPDFVACLSGAVSVAQQDTGGGGAGGGGGDEQQCPTPNATATAPDGSTINVLGPDQVVWNAEAAASCFQMFQYTGFPIEPGQPDSFHSFSMAPREPEARGCFADFQCPGTNVCRLGWCIDSSGTDPENLICGTPIRLRTPTMDLLFQNLDENIPGYIENEGGFVEIDATFPGSEHHFFVIFGRPINPFVDQWNSEQTAQPLDDYPYPGDIAPGYAGGASNE